MRCLVEPLQIQVESASGVVKSLRTLQDAPGTCHDGYALLEYLDRHAATIYARHATRRLREEIASEPDVLPIAEIAPDPLADMLFVTRTLKAQRLILWTRFHHSYVMGRKRFVR